jgi:hypothetical protein
MLPSRTTLLHGGGPVDAFTQHLRDTRVTAIGTNLTMSGTTAPTWDEGILISVSAGDVVFRKVVYADGRFHVQIEQHRERVALTGSRGRASVTFGPETASFVPHPGLEALDRVRQLVTLSPLVARFRRLAERLARTSHAGADVLSVRLTAALVAEIAGEQGAVQQFTRATAAAGHNEGTPTVTEKCGFARGWVASVSQVVRGLEERDCADDETATEQHAVELAFRRVLDMEARWFAAADEKRADRRTPGAEGQHEMRR